MKRPARLTLCGDFAFYFYFFTGPVEARKTGSVWIVTRLVLFPLIACRRRVNAFTPNEMKSCRTVVSAGEK